MPGRCPLSISARRADLRTVSVLTLGLMATEVIAAHSVSCSGRPSATSRTARTRKAPPELRAALATITRHVGCVGVWLIEDHER